MKKVVIALMISTFLLSGFVIAEGIYISKCRTKISQLETLNKDLKFENYNLKTSNKELKKENENLEASQEEKHPIEIKHQECMAQQNYTTAAMNGCTYDAIDDWYKEIDTNIALLKNHMTKQQYNSLVDSQNKWKAYEKAERELLNETIGTFVGSMYTTISAGEKYDIVKARAQDLSALYYYMSDTYITRN